MDIYHIRERVPPPRDMGDKMLMAATDKGETNIMGQPNFDKRFHPKMQLNNQYALHLRCFYCSLDEEIKNILGYFLKFIC